MVPASFQAFFMASAGAAAALIGLLFVAVSVRPETVFGEKAERERALMASASFTALLNAFFISLGALIPNTNIGIFVLVLAPVSILNSLVLGLEIFRQSTRSAALRSASLVLVALILYGYEMYNAIEALRAPGDISPVYSIMGVLMGVYIYAVARAWQLLGGSRRGILSFVVPLLRHNPTDAHEAVSSPMENASAGPVVAPAASTPGDAAPRQGG